MADTDNKNSDNNNKSDTNPIHLRNLPPPAAKFDHPGLIEFLARWIKPEVYIELGVEQSPVIPKLLELVGTCIGVDINPYGLKADNFEFYQMTTDKFFATIMKDKPRTVDLAFVDADHSHKASLQDFDNIFPYVRDDGIILLHDTYPCSGEYTRRAYCEDCYKTAWHIRTKYQDKCEIVTLPFQPGLSIVRKSSRQLLWKE